MKFGTGSTTELTQKCMGQSTNDIRMSTHIYLGERSEALTNESQLRFWYYIYMAKFKEVNACPPPEATQKT